jgi:hypothetical protein
LVGDAANAAWSLADLPRTTTSQLSLNSVAIPVKSASFSNASGSVSTIIDLSDESRLSASNLNGGPISFIRVAAAGVFGPSVFSQSCTANCGVTFAETATGFTAQFNNSPLGANTTLNGSVNIGKTQGSLTSSNSTIGGFTPISDSIKSENDKRTIVFSVLGTNAQAGFSTMQVTTRGTTVLQVAATVGIGTAVYNCFETASTVGFVVPSCSGISIASDGRTVTFNNATLTGSTGSVVFNGVLTARGE